MKLYGLFAAEYDYRPIGAEEQLPHLDYAVAFARERGALHLLHNYGAIQSLDGLLALLHPQGFIAVNDYGQVELPKEGDFEHQRFSQSTGVGLNFPLLKAYFGDSGKCQWLEPDGENGSIYSRLLSHPTCEKLEIRIPKSETNPNTKIQIPQHSASPPPFGNLDLEVVSDFDIRISDFAGSGIGAETAKLFRERFGKAAWEWRQERWNAARANLQHGRVEVALTAYHDALDRHPGNWLLLNEIAWFLTYKLPKPAAGVAMAKAAVELNPACSAELWNTLGDAYYEWGKPAEARSAYQRALRVNPADVRGRYNLAWVLVLERRYTAALQLIAEALGLDETGEYTKRLVEKQTEVLARLAQRNQHKQFLLANRVSSKPAPDAPPRPAMTEAKGMERNGQAE